MPTNDGFDPADPLPRFLTARAEQDMPRTEDDRDGPGTTSRALKAGILITAAAATGVAILAMGNPAALFADVSALMVGDSLPPSATTAQSVGDAQASIAPTADAQAEPPATDDAPARAEVAVSEPAGRDQSETNELSSEILFRQFQAWAAKQDAQAQGEPAQPTQAAPAKVVQPESAATNVPAPTAEKARATGRLVKKGRQSQAVRNARAEMRAQSHRKQARRAQSARAERPPVQDARVQDAPVEDDQTPSFLNIFGLRNQN